VLGVVRQRSALRKSHGHRLERCHLYIDDTASQPVASLTMAA